MNRSSKLLLSAAILAAGYGVACLLGPPSAGYRGHPPQSGQAAPLKRGRPDGVGGMGGIRLLPDAKVVARPQEPRGATAFSTTGLPHSSTGATMIDKARPRAVISSFDATELVPRPAGPRRLPRAKLIDTDPRPLWTDGAAPPRTTQTVPRGAGRPEGIQLSAQSVVGDLPSADSELNRNAKAVFWSPGFDDWSVAASNTGSGHSLAGPPSRQPTVEAPVRTHIIVDGDSLPKLARRYLGDAGRSGEVFALNRDVLPGPDLLPIGTEIKLPAASTATGFGG